MTGEERHEQCRYGVFSGESFRLERDGTHKAFAMPLCGWKLGECPPRLEKMWGGQIDGVEDCVNCPVYDPL